MYKTIHILLVLVVAAFSTTALTSCSESRAEGTSENPSNGMQVQLTEQTAVPILLSRSEGLGTVAEISHISSIYDAQVARLKANPEDAEAWLKLAELFINEARITGEHPYYYPKALEMIRQIPATAFKGPDQQFRALYLESSVQLSLHDFAAAYETGNKARQIFPYNAGIYGVLVDAQVEMGNYERAVELCDRMVGMRPDLRSYARVSYLREIHGEVEGAIEAMEMAVEAGVPGYEQTAWCRLNLAQLHETYGDLQAAEMHYQILLQERPNYPFAIAGLGRIEMKRGNLEAAMARLDEAIALIPEVGFYQDKAELYQQMGEQAKADALYPEILAMMAEDAEAGHNMDLELALVHLELGNNPEQALGFAQKAYPGRENNIEVNGALAEIYLAMGETTKAKTHLEVAMATGSKHPDYKDLKQQL